MKRVADYIFEYLADRGTRHVFLVTGGGAMHLNDALKKERRITYVCHHHEQGAAVAAEGYSRTTGGLAVVSVTSGPGGTNALTGAYGQWTDSVPVLYLSGQVKYETTLASVAGSGLRQMGDQEINIVDLARQVTKYATMVTDPQSIRLELDRAVRLATTGRPGPVWLDIPLDVQGALIDEEALAGETGAEDLPGADEDVVSSIVEELKAAERPVIIAGHGIRQAGAIEAFRALVDRLDIPILSTFNGFDLMATDAATFVGRIGTLGSRAGNFALQNADLVLFLGTRNNIRQVSYNWTSFARHGRKILVDIDEAELNKKYVEGDVLIHSDLGIFIDRFAAALPDELRTHRPWLEWCLERKARYPVVLDEYRKENEEAVNPYVFVEGLTRALDEKAVVVAGNGSACVVLFQAGVVTQGQRVFWNAGCAAMGYALPASIGAAFAAGRDVVCLTGDGSIQMNLQELQTIRQYGLPVKIFLLNNRGYCSIEQTQKNFFDGDFIGCNPESGVTFPDARGVADLYGLAYRRIDSTSGMESAIADVLAHPGAVICEVVLEQGYSFAPKLSSRREPDGRMVSSPLEDLSPFLDRDELRSNMIAEKGEGESV